MQLTIMVKLLNKAKEGVVTQIGFTVQVSV